MYIYKMKLMKYVLMFVVLTSIGMLYERYNKKYDLDSSTRDTELIKKYLLNESAMSNNKSILWVHTSNDINSRNWRSFGSRNSNDLNQNYIISCIESVIKHCSNTFNICLINDDSFEKLLPSWNINLDKIADPIRSHVRTLGILKLLHTYGGLNIPNSMIVLKDLKPLLDELLVDDKIVSGEVVVKNSASVNTNFFPSNKLLACVPGSYIMDELIKKQQVLLSTDNTNEMDFEGELDRELYKLFRMNKLNIINGMSFGVKDMDDNAILVDDLVSNKYLDLCDDLYGIYVPAEELLRRTKYNWFVRLNKSQILKSDTNIGKYILISMNN